MECWWNASQLSELPFKIKGLHASSCYFPQTNLVYIKHNELSVSMPIATYIVPYQWVKCDKDVNYARWIYHVNFTWALGSRAGVISQYSHHNLLCLWCIFLRFFGCVCVLFFRSYRGGNHDENDENEAHTGIQSGPPEEGDRVHGWVKCPFSSFLLHSYATFRRPCMDTMPYPHTSYGKFSFIIMPQSHRHDYTILYSPYLL